jgi:hypothetical protein
MNRSCAIPGILVAMTAAPTLGPTWGDELEGANSGGSSRGRH